jgi:hypothetical protein
MLRLTVAVLLGVGTAACSPTFNWREVRAEPTPLRALLPCKPEKASRQVPMAGRPVELQVLGCEAGGATFAVLHAELGQAGRGGEVLAQWQQATLANLRGTGSPATAFVPPGALALPQSQKVSASGRRADGSPVQSQAAYFTRGTQVFQAVIYADDIRPAWADPFFQGLRFE